MSLRERIDAEIKAAMKSKDKVRLETVRGIKKFIIEKEVSLRPSVEILVQIAKQRRDSIEQYRKGGREDLVAQEAAELAIVEEYLPRQMSDEEVSAVIDEVIATVGATSAKEMGKVMGAAMQQLKGKADGNKIQDMVKAKLNG